MLTPFLMDVAVEQPATRVSRPVGRVAILILRVPLYGK